MISICTVCLRGRTGFRLERRPAPPTNSGRAKCGGLPPGGVLFVGTSGSGVFTRPGFVWLQCGQRDLHEPGFRGYEPAMIELAREAERAIRGGDGAGLSCAAGVQSSEGTQNFKSTEHLPESSTACGLAAVASNPRRFEPPNSARAGQLVLDCVIVEPDEWWIGYHRAASIPSRWAGGLFDTEMPSDAVSRAYLKMEEALAWSRMPLRTGDVWAEIGSAPGGA